MSGHNTKRDMYHQNSLGSRGKSSLIFCPPWCNSWSGKNSFQNCKGLKMGRLTFSRIHSGWMKNQNTSELWDHVFISSVVSHWKVGQLGQIYKRVRVGVGYLNAHNFKHLPHSPKITNENGANRQPNHCILWGFYSEGLSNRTRSDSLQVEALFQSMKWLNVKIKIGTTGALLVRKHFEYQT